ncbi:MAG: NMD3-related protein [Methanobacteriaceae archaeon]|nr:NMD3-related protein [Methanobacteriaceae archaeon]
MFCLKCNKEEELYEDLCKKCYIDEFKLVSVPENAEFTICSHCGATFKEYKWIESEYYDEDIIQDAILKKLEVNNKLENPKITTEILVNRGTMYDCIIHCEGTVLNTHVKEEHPITVKVIKGVCPTCSKYNSGYYEAVIQLRADNRKITDDELSQIEDTIVKETNNLYKTNKLSYIAKRTQLKEGIDYNIGSLNAAQKITDHIQKNYGGIISQSHKIVGQDKSTSKDLYRTWILMRLPSFKKDDIIEYDNKIYQVTNIGSHKITVLNLEDYSTNSIMWKKYDKLKKVAKITDIQSTTITNKTPTTLQILDPSDYSPIDLKLKDFMKNLEIGSNVNVIKINNQIFIIL